MPHLQLWGSLEMFPGCGNLQRHRDALREVKPWGEHLLLAWNVDPSPAYYSPSSTLLQPNPIAGLGPFSPDDTQQPLPQTQACWALPSLGTDSRIRP